MKVPFIIYYKGGKKSNDMAGFCCIITILIIPYLRYFYWWWMKNLSSRQISRSILDLDKIVASSLKSILFVQHMFIKCL